MDGEGDGVGTSCIGDKHLFGTSNNIVGGWSRLLEATFVVDFWVFMGSSTDT